MCFTKCFVVVDGLGWNFTVYVHKFETSNYLARENTQYSYLFVWTNCVCVCVCITYTAGYTRGFFGHVLLYFEGGRGCGEVEYNAKKLHAICIHWQRVVRCFFGIYV